MNVENWVERHMKREVVAGCPPGGAECVIYQWRAVRRAERIPPRLVAVIWILVVPVLIGASVLNAAM
jgi:hypothetical protein